jgi:hypothetical protein
LAYNGLFLLSISGNCRKLLDSGKITEHDGEMFCGSCYAKNFGPKGYGFGGGSGTLSMDDGKGYTVMKYLTTITLIIIQI